MMLMPHLLQAFEKSGGDGGTKATNNNEAQKSTNPLANKMNLNKTSGPLVPPPNNS